MTTPWDALPPPPFRSKLPLMNNGSPTPHLRFAPSPTGWLHLGNARTALLNWLFATRIGGCVTLRLDDTDTARNREEYTTGILEDLAWLNLPYTQLIRQSDRLNLYRAAVKALKACGALYPCWETPEELEAQRRQQKATRQPPLYDRAALRLTAAEISAFKKQGRQPHWRFRLPDVPVTWQDLVRGPVTFQPGHLSDPVLIRADGTFVYNLTSVVDDLDLGITHILRGEDHVTNTVTQIHLFQALQETCQSKTPLPTFGHFPLIVDAQGQSLSKRLGSVSLRDLRAQNIHPLAITSVLSALGTADAPHLGLALADFASEFDIENLGCATPKLDVEDLWRANTRFLQTLPLEAVKEQLRQGAPDHQDSITPDFWEAFQENLERIEDIAHWWEVCHGTLDCTFDASTPPEPEDADFLATALELLPPPPWTPSTWALWTQALKQATGRSGRSLFAPLRRALTGRTSGPEMKALLPRIEAARVKERLGRARLEILNPKQKD